MQENMQPTETVPVVSEPQKMTIDQVKHLIGDFQVELNRVQASRQTAEFRAKRLNDLTDRVKFLKKPIEKVTRALKRLQAARSEVEVALNAENNVKAQIEHLQNQLRAAGF